MRVLEEHVNLITSKVHVAVIMFIYVPALAITVSYVDNNIANYFLTHFPTVDSHPIIDCCIHACDFIRAPRRIVVLDKHTPSSMTTSGPMTTLGPILHSFPMDALGCCIKVKGIVNMHERDTYNCSW